MPPMIAPSSPPRQLLLVLVTALALSSCSAGASPEPQGASAHPDALEQPTSEPTATPAVSEPATAEPTASPTPTETPTPEPPPEPDPAIAAAQQRLIDLGYMVVAPDGLAGAATRSAVMAFQKVNRIGVDGSIGPQTLAALQAPVEPTLQGGEPNRIEVDLDLQVLHLVVGGARVRTVPVSSGNGETYSNKSGLARALTPVGAWRIQRQIRGERVAELGTLYDPKYFWRGFAIHGSNSVPAREASHGCIRVTRADMLWLFDRMPVGMQLLIRGGRFTFTVSPEARGETAEAAGTGQPVVEPTAEPSPTATPSPTPSPSPSPTPSETASPSESPSPSETPSPSTSPSESPSPSPSPSAPAG